MYKIMHHKNAQASLELSISLICAFMLLFACIKIFLWSATLMVHRQEDYESSLLSGRVTAGIGSYLTDVQVNDENTQLKLFNSE